METKLNDDGFNEGEALLYAVNKTAERTKKDMINKACKWLCTKCPAQIGKDNGLQEYKCKRDTCCPAWESLINAMEE